MSNIGDSSACPGPAFATKGRCYPSTSQGISTFSPLPDLPMAWSGVPRCIFLSIDGLPCAARDVLQCRWARLIVEFTDTHQSNRTRLSAWPSMTASAGFQDAMFPVQSVA
ncbi:hypothetical protein BLJ79_13390 [Arthrobacter sp. UCD-GKA]|nr:hypothetical protein BLJ79_13390 [Arthrobacter sp. UCD-GKA]